jgi:hypothetical protein
LRRVVPDGFVLVLPPFLHIMPKANSDAHSGGAQPGREWFEVIDGPLSWEWPL